VGVALSSQPGDSVDITLGESTTAEPVRLVVTTTKDSALVSLEAMSTNAVRYPVAVRHRFAVFRPDHGLTSRVKLSDILLYDGSAGTNPASDSAVLPLMLPRSTLSRDEAVGLYWELYGLREGEVPELELAVVPLDSTTGLFGTLARAVGLAARPGTVLTTWQADSVTPSRIGQHGETPQSIITNFANVAPGTYELRLTARTSGDSVSVRKLIKVR
jgi:hypothetical protein